MKNIRFFLSENFHFLVVKFSVYLNRHVFVMLSHASLRGQQNVRMRRLVRTFAFIIKSVCSRHVSYIAINLSMTQLKRVFITQATSKCSG